jgi:hypothetical protein
VLRRCLQHSHSCKEGFADFHCLGYNMQAGHHSQAQEFVRARQGRLAIMVRLLVTFNERRSRELFLQS